MITGGFSILLGPKLKSTSRKFAHNWVQLMDKSKFKYRNIIFSWVVLLPLYSLVMALSYIIEGEFLYWASWLGISGFFFIIIAWASFLIGVTTIGLICAPIIVPSNELSYSRTVKEQFLFFGVAVIFLWIFRSDGIDFIITFLCFGGAFSVLTGVRWEQSNDK